MAKHPLLAAIAAVTLSTWGAVATAAGAYASDSVLQSINRANAWFRSDFPLVGPNLPGNARINSVNWRYELAPLPAGATFSAQLCSSGAPICQDISALKAGSTQAFKGSPASTQFYLQYRVNHRSAFAPLPPRPAQIIVNWGD